MQRSSTSSGRLTPTLSTYMKLAGRHSRRPLSLVRARRKKRKRKVIKIVTASSPHHTATGQGKAEVAPGLLELLEVVEPVEDDRLARLLNLAREKDLVENRIDLVKVEDEVELADVLEEGVWTREGRVVSDGQAG